MRMAGGVVERDAIVAGERREPERLAQTPRRRMIRARRITGEPEPADRVVAGVESETAAERDRPADAAADHRIVIRTEPRVLPVVCRFRADGIAAGKPEQRIPRRTRLHPRIQ